MNHIMYADDICVMAPTAIALQKSLDVCFEYSIANDLLFNPVKSVCIVFNPLLHAIRNNGIRFFSFWNSKENVSNKVIPKKKFLICCE